MLDVSPKNLRQEVEELLRVRDSHTKAMEDVVDQYVGSFYQEGRQPEITSHENHPFEHVVNTIPALVYNNPRVNVKSRRPVVHRELAESLTHGLNRWISDVNLADKLLEIAVDAQFSFGVALLTLEALPGHEGLIRPPLRPGVHRISWRQFFMDDRGVKPRILGHQWAGDYDDLMAAKYTDPDTGQERAIYNREVLRRLTPDSHEGRLGEESYYQHERMFRTPRRQVKAFDVWVPERNMIYTMAHDPVADDVGYLREPRPFFGPPWGPYILFGIYPVPDEAYPLPPLAVTAELVDELNAHLDQVMEQADQMRQFVVVNGQNSKAVSAIQVAHNGQVIAIPGFDRTQAEVYTFGAPSKEQLDYSERLRARLDRKSGLTDFQRGNVTGDATATENQLAQAATDFRRKFMQRQFQKQVRQLLTTAAWYMTESRNIVFPIPVPDESDPLADSMAVDPSYTEGAGRVRYAGTDQMVDGVFVGGRYPGEDFNFYDLELEIEPMSMELMTEALLQRRITQGLGFVMANAQAIVTTPWINWPEIFDDHFDALNIPDGRKYVNWELVEQLAGVAFQAGAPIAAGGTEGTPAPNPRALQAGSGTQRQNGGQELQLAGRIGEGQQMGGLMRAQSAVA